MKIRPASAALVLVAVLAGGGVAACGADPAPQGTTTATSVTSAAVAPSSGAMVDADTFAAALATPGTTVVDVRTPAEYAQGHLPGAVNIDVSAPDFATRIAALDRAGSYAVYCHSGNRSAAAVAAMTGAGFTHVYHLAGGIGAWADSGRSVVTG
ncbi:rhodanese-like domain-containing protein [Humibacillus xanthopallidus]|uniref:Rhodanese-related sulfurtransferase n=1 Tax=Humibacillus xanthopallidus TaxID=412689 RepID=A0A543HFU8_9MICO|nr:rhodanese-like domain-containing protein [Humibacillus xanthopallidus]TQM57205.1 rhodanese-related sulfurtransferase [Humibacillus xanthopallidus]